MDARHTSNFDALMTSPQFILEINDDSFVERVVRSKMPVLLAFCANDRADSQRLLALLSNALPHCCDFVTIAKASPDESPELAARFGVVPGPSLLLLCDGKVCYQFIGEPSRRDLDDVLARARGPATREPAFSHDNARLTTPS
jgi:thioredoxin-like negative regulator of GroEL